MRHSSVENCRKKGEEKGRGEGKREGEGTEGGERERVDIW